MTLIVRRKGFSLFFVQVLRLDSEELCLPGEEGEICVKTESLMKGYKNREEETSEFFTSDGFARMGDLGLYLTDGTLQYVDRIKDIIK